MSKDYILENFTIEKIIEKKAMIAELYREYGVVIFTGLLSSCKEYGDYLSDLRKVMGKLVSRHTKETLPEELGELLLAMVRHNPLDGRIVTDMGTQANKFLSFNQLKYSPWVKSLVDEIFGENSISLTPHAGDTLHFFPPGEKFHRYNLPPHQDYQYLMQSPKQLTFYMGISNHKEGVGGLKIWEKSHKLGILESTTNEYGAYEVYEWQKNLEGFEVTDLVWNAGDFGFFDSLLAHSSVPNTSTDSTRIVQIFRFSDISHPVADSYDFYSTTYDRRGIKFNEVHSDFFVPREKAEKQKQVLA